MFYYPAVLTRQGGCFSTIWLMATKGTRVTRRDLLKVNVKSTCNDIMNYLLERVPPPQPGLPPPRFSLYLSSQLQYGVIVVYHRQCAILLEEIHSVVGQLLKKKTSKNIDLEEQNRQSLLLPDALSLMEEAEGALDPLFGMLDLQEAVPSPSALMKFGEEYLRESSPEHPERRSPTAAAVQDMGITASPESITLRETEPVPIPEFQGVELVDHHQDTIDLLLAHGDQFPEGDLERARAPDWEVERRGRDEDRDRTTQEITASTTELQPSEEAALLPTDVSEERPEPRPDHLTPVSEPILPSPPSAPRPKGAEMKKKRKWRRRRQLVFFDPETQLPQEVLEKQIKNPLTETRHPPLRRHSSLVTRSAADLLNTPCTFLPEEVLSLWQQLEISPISGSDLQVGERQPESTDSEKERDQEMAEVSEREEERLEPSSTEAQAEHKIDISGLGSLTLDGSDQKERSREISPMQLSDKEGSIVSRSVSVLQDIPEVIDERPEAEFPGLLLDEDESAALLFTSVLPPKADRHAVSTMFQRLLGLASARKVRVEQQEPYSDILIIPGPDHKEAVLALQG